MDPVQGPPLPPPPDDIERKDDEEHESPKTPSQRTLTEVAGSSRGITPPIIDLEREEGRRRRSQTPADQPWEDPVTTPEVTQRKVAEVSKARSKAIMVEEAERTKHKRSKQRRERRDVEARPYSCGSIPETFSGMDPTGRMQPAVALAPNSLHVSLPLPQVSTAAAEEKAKDAERPSDDEVQGEADVKPPVYDVGDD